MHVNLKIPARFKSNFQPGNAVAAAAPFYIIVRTLAFSHVVESSVNNPSKPVLKT